MTRFVIVEVRDTPNMKTKVVNVNQIREVCRQYVDAISETRYTVWIGEGKHGWCEYLLPRRVDTDLKAKYYLEGTFENGKRQESD
jgi:hypothetical protein